MSAIDTQNKNDRATYLLGDMLDEVLAAVRRHVDWKNLKEKTQRALIEDVRGAQKRAIRHAEQVFLAHGHTSTAVRWTEWKFKGGNVEPKLTATYADGITDAFIRHSTGVLLFVNPDVFMEERHEQEVLPDQPDLLQDTKTDDERPIAEVNAERLRQGIKPLPVEDGDTTDNPGDDSPETAVDAAQLEGEPALEDDGDAQTEEPAAEDAPPTQPADGELVEQHEEEGAAEPPIGEIEEVETPPQTVEKPARRRRPPRAPKPGDAPAGA